MPAPDSDVGAIATVDALGAVIIRLTYARGVVADIVKMDEQDVDQLKHLLDLNIAERVLEYNEKAEECRDVAELAEILPKNEKDVVDKCTLLFQNVKKYRELAAKKRDGTATKPELATLATLEKKCSPVGVGLKCNITFKAGRKENLGAQDLKDEAEIMQKIGAHVKSFYSMCPRKIVATFNMKPIDEIPTYPNKVQGQMWVKNEEGFSYFCINSHQAPPTDWCQKLTDAVNADAVLLPLRACSGGKFVIDEDIDASAKPAAAASSSSSSSNEPKKSAAVRKAEEKAEKDAEKAKKAQAKLEAEQEKQKLKKMSAADKKKYTVLLGSQLS